MISFFKAISDSITYTEPIKTYILCTIYAILFMVSIIIIGHIANILERYQIRLLSKFLGNKAANIICNRLTFPGIVVHELSHAAFASIFGAKVTKIKLISLRNDGRLGWIEYQTRGKKILQGLQHSWSACAPTLVGLFLEYLMYVSFIGTTNVYVRTILMYFMISVADHMSMSKQDIINYIRGSWAMFIVLWALIFILRTY